MCISNHTDSRIMKPDMTTETTTIAQATSTGYEILTSTSSMHLINGTSSESSTSTANSLFPSTTKRNDYVITTPPSDEYELDLLSTDARLRHPHKHLNGSTSASMQNETVAQIPQTNITQPLKDSTEESLAKTDDSSEDIEKLGQVNSTTTEMNEQTIPQIHQSIESRSKILHSNESSSELPVVVSTSSQEFMPSKFALQDDTKLNPLKNYTDEIATTSDSPIEDFESNISDDQLGSANPISVSSAERAESVSDEVHTTTEVETSSIELITSPNIPMTESFENDSIVNPHLTSTEHVLNDGIESVQTTTPETYVSENADPNMKTTIITIEGTTNRLSNANIAQRLLEITTQSVLGVTHSNDAIDQTVISNRSDVNTTSGEIVTTTENEPAITNANEYSLSSDASDESTTPITNDAMIESAPQISLDKHTFKSSINGEHSYFIYIHRYILHMLTS